MRTLNPNAKFDMHGTYVTVTFDVMEKAQLRVLILALWTTRGMEFSRLSTYTVLLPLPPRCPQISSGFWDLDIPAIVGDTLWLVTQEPCWTCGYLGVNTTQSSGGLARHVTQPRIDRNLVQKSACGGSFGARRLLATV